MIKKPNYLPKNLENLKSKTLNFFGRKKSHVLLGEVSLEIGYSLKSTEYILYELQEDNKIERLADEENRKLGLDEKTFSYRLKIK